MRTLAVVLLAAACGGSPKQPETPPPATSSMLDCGAVAEHVATTVSADKPRPGINQGMIKDLVSSRCQADAWTDDTKQCLDVIKSVADGRACAAKMTDEQRTAIKTAAKALRKDGPTGDPADDHSSDWIEHVVEPPGTKTR